MFLSNPCTNSSKVSRSVVVPFASSSMSPTHSSNGPKLDQSCGARLFVPPGLVWSSWTTLRGVVVLTTLGSIAISDSMTLFKLGSYTTCNGPSFLVSLCGARTPSLMPSQPTLSQNFILARPMRLAGALLDGLENLPSHLLCEMRERGKIEEHKWIEQTREGKLC